MHGVVALLLLPLLGPAPLTRASDTTIRTPPPPTAAAMLPVRRLTAGRVVLSPRGGAQATGRARRGGCSKLAAALASIGGSTCVAAAAAAKRARPTNLRLRSAGIDAAEAPPIASFSVRYNTIGEVGAARQGAAGDGDGGRHGEVGKVGCSVGDTGGRALEAFAKRAKKLYMLCVESNFWVPRCSRRSRRWAGAAAAQSL